MNTSIVLAAQDGRAETDVVRRRGNLTHMFADFAARSQHFLAEFSIGDDGLERVTLTPVRVECRDQFAPHAGELAKEYAARCAGRSWREVEISAASVACFAPQAPANLALSHALRNLGFGASPHGEIVISIDGEHYYCRGKMLIAIEKLIDGHADGPIRIAIDRDEHEIVLA
jgi:hypothetical protein